MTEILYNDWTLTAREAEALDRILARLNARKASLYRTSEGLFAYVIGGAGEEHLGVPIR